MEISDQLKGIYRQTADALRGREKRLFMAQVVKMLGNGGQRFAERELGWNRGTIRKGLYELNQGVVIQDNFSARGRKRSEEHLPGLLVDIQDVLWQDARTDRITKTVHLSTREIRGCLITQKGYLDEALPTNETLRTKVIGLGFRFYQRGTRKRKRP
ncbi:MAG: hypothetical protein H6662_07555 [Ardenticatenaceae bacterium]|nr:hypothetical protein [Ardenticatenaceae bacterium]MCB8991537.1 hypothetical protein [Ardenticatenaceae bacterium]MCB9005101.1 hypothetical protein [Ardenticatenaceae bacterium]